MIFHIFPAACMPAAFLFQLLVNKIKCVFKFFLEDFKYRVQYFLAFHGHILFQIRISLYRKDFQDHYLIVFPGAVVFCRQ